MLFARWDEFEKRNRERAARKLLQIGAVFVSEYQVNVTKSYPPASKENEFPRFRTGTGRSAAAYWPTAVDDVMRKLFVKVGVREPGWYMAHLEKNLKRFGFLETLKRVRTRLQAIAGRK